jgi:protein-S-isoprenylcysteine O-methyltransferase Ste14
MNSERPDLKLKLGNILFKYRSFTPLPVIGAVFLFFKPLDFGKLNGWIVACGLGLALMGELIRVLAVGYAGSGTSGRENYLRAESINSTGLYSLSRNPLYIGNYLIFSGLLLVFANIWALLIVSLFLIIQYHLIIRSEERFLTEKYGEAYRNYCRETPRIFSGLGQYRRPESAFNLQKVLFKENDSLFNLLMVFVIILVIRELTFYERMLHKSLFIWLASLLIGFYLVIKVLKKRRMGQRDSDLS